MDEKAFTRNEHFIGKMGVHFAEPRSTAVRYSNAIDFDKASLLSNAQIHAQTSSDDRHAPSSQRGVNLCGHDDFGMDRFGGAVGACLQSANRDPDPIGRQRTITS
jgi:hypothetical protein